MTDYDEFLAAKQHYAPDSGVRIVSADLGPHLKPFQAELVAWCLRKGRAGLFAATGLGKTRMQVTWADHATRHCGRPALILAPLAVAQQTVREAAACGIDVTYAADQQAAAGHRIVISNYERLHKFDPAAFGVVVLDESSILKSFSGTTKKALVNSFRDTPWRLAYTATPAPNDIEELCNHADFLGVMSPAEMRSTFFIADSRGEFMRYRLKGHAKSAFYRWLSSWAMSLDVPSDLGFDDAGYVLPPLIIEPRIVDSDYQPDDALFALSMEGVTERAQVRRASLGARVAAAVELVGAEPQEQWLLWCGLNDESDALEAAIPGAVTISGSDDPDVKAARLLDFAEGRTQVLVTKPTIAGYGLNLQSCARMIFVGLGDSYEQYHQALRRCWRYGQTRPVKAWLVVSDLEKIIVANVQAKERAAQSWRSGLVREVVELERAELLADTSAADDYEPRRALTIPDWLTNSTGGHVLSVMDEAHGDDWALYNGDSAEVLPQLPDRSVDLSVFSPPFSSTYTYSPSNRDLGNVSSDSQFWQQFSFISRELLRVMRPGRLVAVHVANLPAYENRDGASGRKDFRGDTIRHFEQAGFVYHSEICIDKNPQAQAIRTHSKGLLFVQLGRDSAGMWQAWADYVVVFRAPGKNDKPIVSDLTQNEWIEWARPVWSGIRETDVLGVREARENDDERHLCPLQLPVIERCVRLWSAPGETVLSPFAGIGSEGVGALRHGRRFVGVELKPAYFRVAVRNLRAAAQAGNELTLDDLFDEVPA